jgi:hypothetical protein
MLQQKLDSLQPVKDPKEVAALRHLQSTIQSQITVLEGLGYSKTSYRSHLGRRLMKLLPNKLQEKWTEEVTNDITDIECVLKLIRLQTEAAKRFNRLKTAKKKKKPLYTQHPVNGDHNSITIGDRSQITSISINKTQF